MAANRKRVGYPLTYNPILDYHNKIEAGEITVSAKVQKLYRKLALDLTDLENEYEYRPARANHVIEFIEMFCKHSKGKWGGKPVILELWEKALLAAAFGFVHKIDGTRQYQEVLLLVARKNGKSTLGAAVALYLMVGDCEPGAEVYAVATKYNQAKVIWGEAKRMVRKSPVLLQSKDNPDGLIKPLVAELAADFNDSTFVPLGSDSDTLDGLNVHGATMDEVHAWKDKNLYDVIVDGCSAREEPMIFEFTTQGTVREGVLDQLYDEAERVINGYFDTSPGAYRNPHFLPVIYELDNRKEWTVPAHWIKANPGLGTIKKHSILEAKVKKAQANPRLVKNLLCKDFNVRETSTEAWLTFEQLDNTALFNLKKLRPRYGIGGADLSSTTDLTAAKVIFMVPGDTNIYVLQMYWLPEDLIEQRVTEDKIPYDLWIDQGLMRTCPGNKVHYKHVTDWFREVRQEKDIYIPWTGYDAWSATYWVEEMQYEFGKESMIAVHQGKKTLSGPMHELGADLEKKLIVYNNHPIDKWCLANTSVDVDKNGNIQPVKTTNRRRRIDGTAALLNAYVALGEKRSEYMSLI